MEIGDHIIFLHQGQNWWEGSNTELIKADNQEVNEFVFASKLMKSKYQ
jgi:phospholipid/cholesterol/gamma-HCH transport system ATP-binding protein